MKSVEIRGSLATTERRSPVKSNAINGKRLANQGENCTLVNITDHAISGVNATSKPTHLFWKNGQNASVQLWRKIGDKRFAVDTDANSCFFPFVFTNWNLCFDDASSVLFWVYVLKDVFAICRIDTYCNFVFFMVFILMITMILSFNEIISFNKLTSFQMLTNRRRDLSVDNFNFLILRTFCRFFVYEWKCISITICTIIYFINLVYRFIRFIVYWVIRLTLIIYLVYRFRSHKFTTQVM